MPAADLFAEHFTNSTNVLSANAPCDRGNSQALRAPSGFVRIETRFDCEESVPERINYRTMFAAAPAHVHYAKLHRDGQLLGEALITDTADTWDIESLNAASTWTFGSFVRVGVEHIAGGIDHIAFLFGLLLIAGTLTRSVIAVTGFTLGHSVSLAAAVLGYVSADGKLVEAFIGFTVMLVAVEYFLLRRRTVRRYALTAAAVAIVTGAVAFVAGLIDAKALAAYIGFGLFAASYLLLTTGRSKPGAGSETTPLLFVATTCFGLVHGFGFAGFLMDTGLLGGALFVPLLGFNVGVELGQLSIVALTLLIAMLFKQYVPQVLPQLVAAGLCGIGVFWFVGRTLS